MYNAAVDGMMQGRPLSAAHAPDLVKRSSPSKLVYIGQLRGGGFDSHMDHLVCFVPGMLALGAQGNARHMALARELMHTCYKTYERQPTGLGPEIAHFDSSGDFTNAARFYILRPGEVEVSPDPTETVESLFVMYRVTGNPVYQEWGWQASQPGFFLSFRSSSLW
jgi:hypothetical protein